MGRDMPYKIVLPADYEASARQTKKYPVIYLLHGLTGHYDNWVTKTKLIDYLRSYEFIIVTPEGENGWYTDSASAPNEKYETYILNELIPEIDGKFRTIAERRGRVIAGLSMGGYGSLKFGLKYPDKFTLVGSFSGALEAASWTEKVLADAGIKGAIPDTIKRAFGLDASLTRTENDIYRLVRSGSPEYLKTLPFIYLDCGTEDFLVQNNRDFAGLLSEKKIPHEFRELPGGHTWPYWDSQVQEFLRTAGKRFADTSEIVGNASSEGGPNLPPLSAERIATPNLLTQTSRIAEIQRALGAAKLDGWLFYDFRGSDILIPRILKTGGMSGSRRWYYYIPAKGEPTKIVHAIEPEKLDGLPGRKLIYREWQLINSNLKEAITAGFRPGRKPRVAMQYSPNNDIPYISRVDAGTIEMVRSLGVDVVTSADLVQRFEAVWTPEQLQMHTEAGARQQKIILEAFAEIRRRILADTPTTEIDVQKFMMRRFDEEGMNPEPMIVAVNANAASPHYFPTANRNSAIKRGDLVLIDTVTRMKKAMAPATDLTWVGYVGDAVPEEYVKIWNIVREARDAAFNFVKASFQNHKTIRGSEVDDVARGVIRRAGYADQFLHRTGHSIGEEGHGNGANIDNLETRDTRALISGTAFSIEPGIYLEGKFGIRSEIDVYVSDNDATITAPHQTEILAILK